MTVQVNINRVDYTADGVLTTFPYIFEIIASTDLQVYVAGVLKTISVDYTVTGVGSPTGGNVVFGSAPSNGAAVAIVRNVPMTQDVALPANDKFPSTTMENALDKLTFLVQQLYEKSLRTLGFATASSLTNPVLPDGETGKFLRWLTNTQLGNADIVPAGSLAVPVDIAHGGTGATTAAAARAALGINISLNAADYGFAPGASAGTNRAALQAAHDALPAAGGEIRITTYGNHIDAAINVTKPLKLIGPGTTEVSTPGTFVLYLDTASQVGFNVTSKSGFVLRDVSIDGAAGTTHVVLNGPTGVLKGTESAYFENVVFRGGATHIDVLAAIFWHVTSCHFVNYGTAGVRVQNTLDNDQGDSLIDGNCTFNGSVAGWGVIFQTGAGLKIINNKFLDGTGGIKVDRVGSIAVVDLKILGNSIENYAADGILITRSAGNLALLHVQINDNQIASLGGTGVGIRIEPTAGAGDLVVGATIQDNIINNVATCLKLRNVNVLQTDGNDLAATGGTIWNVDSTVTNVRVYDDFAYDFTTFMSGTPGTNFIMQGGKLTVAQLPSVSAGSTCYAADAKRPGEAGHVVGDAAVGGGSGAPAYVIAGGTWRV